jgi:hypothetical protein
MSKRAYRWKWTAAIDPDNLPDLQKLAGNLGFYVTAPGGFQGKPSPAAMLDALADAYRLDSGAVIDALRGIGVVNKSAVISDAQPLDEDEQTGGAAE